MRDHQSAFTVEADGELLPGFLTVMDRADDPDGSVRAGNEWVVEARLADARFFWSEDVKQPLAERLERLEHLTFHAELGSFAAKGERVRQLTAVLADVLDWGDQKEAAEEAATLLKADLTTEMVKEFTSLQGTVGGIYARDEGYPAEVWQAIYDQYLPVSAEDRIPRGSVGLLTGLADRLDTLVGIFGLGLVPSGSRDPFGLRRAAQGLVRIVLEADLPLDLDLAGAKAVLLYGDRLERSGDDVLSDLRPFLHDRARHLLGREGFAYDEIEAALAVGAPLPDVRARVRALHAVREEPAFLEVVLAAKRIANIVKDAPEHELDEKLLREDAEKSLWTESRTLREEVVAAEAEGEYERALRAIAGFAQYLERFFTDVLVMDEDRALRHNRIALLQGIQRTLSRIARLTEMVVDKAELRRGGGTEGD
ncbi:MAG: glycine--tRNA ligase subunit beta [Thermoanaerobaculia bacterium]